MSAMATFSWSRLVQKMISSGTLSVRNPMPTVLPGLLNPSHPTQHSAIHGISRWLNRLWTLCHQHVQACKPHPPEACLPETHTSEQPLETRPLEIHPPDSVAVKKKVVSATHKAIKRVNYTQSTNSIARGRYFTGSSAGMVPTLEELNVPTAVCWLKCHQFSCISAREILHWCSHGTRFLHQCSC